MQENTSTVELAKTVDMSTELDAHSSISSTIVQGSAAVAIILSLAVLMRAIASLVKSCQD